MKRRLVIGALIVSALTGCGGGGGTGSNDSSVIDEPTQPIIATVVKTPIGEFDSPKITARYQYGRTLSFTTAVRYLYPVDLDGDGIDELVVAGFQSQPTTPQAYLNTQISIFGWREGRFNDLTAQLLPTGANLVEGVGDVVFGDFNSDGKKDIFLSAYVDMDHFVNAYQLINVGTHFEKRAIENIVGWQHGAAAADINRDGYTDVYASGYGNSSRIYLGGPTGLTPQPISAYIGGSGVVLADFFGDGTTTAVVVDHGGDKARDFALLSFSTGLDGSMLVTEVEEALPGSILSESGHDIRVKAFDFDLNGLIDVVVFTREWWDGSQWPVNSRVQFLMNMGSGRFSDVTSTMLQNYATNSNAAYHPVFVDLNGDGRTDIFLSEAQWSGIQNSTAILINKGSEGFADVARGELSSQFNLPGGMATVLRGPNQKLFFAFEDQAYGGTATLSLSEFRPY
jgi:hypothetical protein